MIFLGQKIINPNYNYRKAAKNTFAQKGARKMLMKLRPDPKSAKIQLNRPGVFFCTFGSCELKAACKTLMKLTIGFNNFPSILGAAFFAPKCFAKHLMCFKFVFVIFCLKEIGAKAADIFC